MNVSKAEQTARRAALLQYVIAGHTYAQLRRDVGVTDKTLAHDLKVINGQLQEWAAEQQNRALATAIAQYQRVVDQAWADHDADAENERKWLGGEFAEQTQVPDAVDGARLEKRTQQQFRSQKADYLRVIVSATQQLCKLAGLERAATEIVQQNNLVQSFTILLDRPEERAPEIPSGAGNALPSTVAIPQTARGDLLP